MKTRERMIGEFLSDDCDYDWYEVVVLFDDGVGVKYEEGRVERFSSKEELYSYFKEYEDEDLDRPWRPQEFAETEEKLKRQLNRIFRKHKVVKVWLFEL